MDVRPQNRSRSRSPPPWHWQPKSPRRDSNRGRPYRGNDHKNRRGDRSGRRGQDTFAQEQTRRNQANEDAQMREWVSKEDEFVLKQSKKKALIRAREGRAKPIDWLALVLGVIDPTRELLEEDSIKAEVDVKDPTRVLETLDYAELTEVLREVEQYLSLETERENRIYWNVSDTRKVGDVRANELSGSEIDLQGTSQQAERGRPFRTRS